MLPRMRSATRCLEEIKKIDPETEITLGYIRRLIRTEAIPVTKMGKRLTVDLDQLIEYIANDRAGKQQESKDEPAIRPVSETLPGSKMPFR